MAADKPFSLFSTFVQLDPKGDAKRMRVNSGFWKSLKGRKIRGRLVGGFRMSRNTAWERHPDGDGLLILLSGAIEVQIEEDDIVRVVDLPPGRAFVVPCNTWHRLMVRERGELIFITPGPRIERRSARKRRSSG